MDKLVQAKFQLKRDSIVERDNKLIDQLKAGYSGRGLLRSSMFIRDCYESLSESAKNTIDAFLDSYAETQNDTGQSIIIDNEKEIEKEIIKLVDAEYKRINDIVKDMSTKTSMPLPKDLGGLQELLQDYAESKAEILIETERRKAKSHKEHNPLVFVSYATEEVALAYFIEKIITRLSDGKIEVFIAKRDIKPGDDPNEVMMEIKLKSANAVIPICSTKSRDSHWLWWESASVWAKGNKVYPLFTNISAEEFGAPLTLVAQGKNYFDRDEFEQSLRTLLIGLGFDIKSQALSEDEAVEYKKLSKEYLKGISLATVTVDYKKISMESDLHEYSLLLKVENRSEKAFDDVALDLYFPTEYLEKQTWDYPHLQSSVTEDLKGYTCITFMYASLPDAAKKEFAKGLYPGKSLCIFGEYGITRLQYQMNDSLHDKRFNFEVKWKLYVNKGASAEGSIPLSSIQCF